MEQLEKGEVWLAHSMKMLDMKPWFYVGFSVFPNIDNRKTLEATGLVKNEDKSKVNHQFKDITVTESLFIKILTKNELDDPEHKVLNEIFVKTNKLPADGDILYLTNI